MQTIPLWWRESRCDRYENPARIAGLNRGEGASEDQLNESSVPNDRGVRQQSYSGERTQAEGLSYAANAAKTRFGVIGYSRMRLPVASKKAFAIAPAQAAITSSPAPVER
jgi:hypothetical protein